MGRAEMAALRSRIALNNGKGKKNRVVLSLKRYRRLLEDLHDLAVIAERRSERAISFDSLKRRLKKDGLL